MKKQTFLNSAIVGKPILYSYECFDNKSLGITENGALKNPKIHTMPLDHNKLLEFEDIKNLTLTIAHRQLTTFLRFTSLFTFINFTIQGDS